MLLVWLLNVTIPDIVGIVDTPDTFKVSVCKSSTKTPPLKVDTPNTSNNCVGCVLPMPTLLLLKS